MNLEQEMSEPLGRLPAPDIDDVLGVNGGLLGREPAQRQRKLRLAAAQRHEGIERADLQSHVGNGDDRVRGAVEEATGHSDDVPRQQEVDDLALAVA